MNKTAHTILPLAAVAALALAANSAQATPVGIANSGFESPDIGENGSVGANPPASADLCGWNGAGTVGYALNIHNDGSAYAGVAIAGAHSGDQYIVLHTSRGGALSSVDQDTGLLWSELTDGETLTVSAWTTYPDNLPAGDTYFRLNAVNGSGISSGLLPVTSTAAGVWTQQTWIYTVTQADIDAASAGGWGAVNVEIETIYVSGAASQTAIDDVSLEHSGAGDTVSPTNTSVDPNGVTEVPVDTNLVATFDEGVKKGTGNIEIWVNGAGSPVQTIPVTSGAVTVCGAAVTIDPPSALAGGTPYYVEIDSGAILDLNGNSFDGISGNTTWSFTTGTSIAGVTVEAVSSEIAGFDRLALYTINGNGFQPNGEGTHSIAPDGNMWLNQGVFAGGTPDPLSTPPFITYDLGANYDLNGFTVWNYNETTLTGRGANAVTIKVAPSEGGSFTTVTTTTFNEAPDNDTTDFGQIIDLSSFPAADNARLVRIEITSNHGGDNEFVGLSEIRFEGTPATGGGNNYSDWISGFFPGVTDPAIVGLDADPDLDGNDNGVENYFGTAPDAFSQGLVSGTVDTGANTFTFTHPLNATPADDLTATYRWSTDLQAFYDDGASNVAGTTTVTFSDPTPDGDVVSVTATISGIEIPDKLFVDVEVN